MIKRKRVRIELTPEQIAEMQYAASMFSLYADQLEGWASAFLGFLDQGEKQDLNRFINAAQTIRKGFVERIYDRSEDYSREEIAAVFSNVAKLVKANDTVKMNAIRNVIESEYRINDKGDLEFYDPATETPYDELQTDLRKRLVFEVQSFFWANNIKYSVEPENTQFSFNVKKDEKYTAHWVKIFTKVNTENDYLIQISTISKSKQFTDVEKAIKFLKMLLG